MIELRNDIALVGLPHLYENERRKIESWYRNPAGSALLVKGPSGSGKTQLVGRALASFDLIHIGCFGGILTGEILEELAVAFTANGDERLHQALCQDSAIELQLEVLKEILLTLNMGIWFDDADFLGKGFFSHFESQNRELTELFRIIATAVQENLRVIFTVGDDRDLHDGLGRIPFSELVIPCIQPVDAESLWQSEVNATVPPVPPIHLPLEVKIAGRLVDAGISVQEGALEVLIAQVWESLSADARQLYSACLLAGGNLTRGLLRFVEREGGVDEKACQELFDRGILDPGRGESNRLFVNPAVSSLVLEMISEDLTQSAPILEILADFWKESGRRSRRIWDLLRAVALYAKADAMHSSYELQREVVEELLRRNYFDLSETILQQTIQKMTGRKRAVVLGNLAIVKKNQGELDEALALYKEAWDEFENIEDPHNSARVLHQLGNTYYLKGDLETAIRHYDKSRSIAAECGDEAVATAAQVQTANVLFIQGEFTDAANHYQHGLESAERLGDKRLILAVLLQIGQIHLFRKHLLEADGTLLEAEKLSDQLGDYVSKGKALQFRGLVALSRRDFERAAGLFGETLEVSRLLRDPALDGAARFHLGQINLELGDFVTALQHFIKAAERFSEYKCGDVKAVWRLVRDVAERVGDDSFRQLAKQANIDWNFLQHVLEEDRKDSGAENYAE